MVQDEDVNSDEELVLRNQTESINDLRKDIEHFVKLKKLRDKQV